MSRIFKTLPPIFRNVTNHTANKRWQIANTETGSYGVAIYEGLYITGSFNTVDGVTTPADAQTSNGEYKHLIHRSVNNLYYISPKDVDPPYDNPARPFCVRPFQHKELHGRVTVVSIPSAIFGDSIKPGSFELTSGSVVIKDDSEGNLYQVGYPSQSVNVSASTLFVGFNEGYQFQDASKRFNITPLDHTSRVKVVPRAQNIAFGDTTELTNERSNGTFALFDGTGSFGPFSSDDATDVAFVEVEGSTGYDFESDFAINFNLKLPTSQPVNSSWEGDWTSTSDVNLRTEVTTPDNVILSKREQGGNNPIEIAITGSSDRRLIIRRSSRAGGTPMEFTIPQSITSNTWYNILVQKTGSVFEIAFNQAAGTFNATTPDTVANQPLNNDTNIHIGGRPFGYKRKAYDPGVDRWVDDKRYRNISRPFQGGISDVRIFDRAIPSQATASLFADTNTFNHVGNIFYEHGMAVLTVPSGAGEPLSALHDITSRDFEIDFRGSYPITEHLYMCTLLDSEYNVTQNPTVLDPASSSMGVISSSFSEDDYFNPYITTVGLYNDDNELLAIGKLAQPIQKPSDYDITFMLRFDS